MTCLPNYGAIGLITNITLETGEQLSYTYDTMQRLKSESRSMNSEVISVVEYSYDAVGNRTEKTLDGITVNYNHPYGISGNRLTSWNATSTNNYELLRTISVAGNSSEEIGTNDMFGVLWVSNSIAVTPKVDGTNFSINSFVVGSGTQTVVAAIRDEAGNVGYATNTITTRIVTNATYSYSDAGCLTNIVYTGISYPETTTSLEWDSKYQLTSVNTNGSIAESYGYDSLGRRLWISDGSTTNWLVYDGIHVVAEIDSAGTLKKSYTWGTGIDNLLSFTTYGATTNTYYATTDHLGTIHALTDESGNIVESYKYDAWGKVLEIKDGSGNTLTESSIGNRYLWQGREYSYVTGLYNFRARYYDPITGRWLSKDPIGISGGLNQYVFCDNNGINFIDPYGLWWSQDEWKSAGAGFAEGWSRGGQGVVNIFTGGLFKKEYGVFYKVFNNQWQDIGYESNECNKEFKMGMTGGRVAEVSLLIAGGVKMSGSNPWLGKVEIHGPHGGGPHQYKHLQIMIRAGQSATKHFRIPWL